MSRTPAAELARLKVQYSSWRIERHGEAYRASHRYRRRTLSAPTTAALENLLISADGRKAR